MLKNIYNNEVIKLAQKIKQKNILRLSLWTSGIFLTLLWLAMVLATSISTGEKKILGETIIVKDLEQINNYFKDTKWEITNIVNDPMITATFRHVDKIVDLNPLCLTYDNNLTGWYICILLAPIGYMSCIYLIAYLKNIITPQAVKQTLRKALIFGYIKQKDVDYICDEIDYNLGIKKRIKEEDIKKNIKQIIEYEKKSKE